MAQSVVQFRPSVLPARTRSSTSRPVKILSPTRAKKEQDMGEPFWLINLSDVIDQYCFDEMCEVVPTVYVYVYTHKSLYSVSVLCVHPFVDDASILADSSHL